MTIQTTIDKLRGMKMNGMVAALEEQTASASCSDLSFVERLGLLVDREATHRSNRQYQMRLRLARLKEPQARIEAIDFKGGRGLDKGLLLDLAGCDWVRKKQSVFVIGQTGVGKTYVACALAQRACLDGLSVRYYRLPRLLQEVAIARAAGRYPQLLAYLAKVDVLVLDDWGISGLAVDERRDFLEIIEDRYGLRSTVIASQVPVDRWHELIGDPTIADQLVPAVDRHLARADRRSDDR